MPVVPSNYSVALAPVPSPLGPAPQTVPPIPAPLSTSPATTATANAAQPAETIDATIHTTTQQPSQLDIPVPESESDKHQSTADAYIFHALSSIKLTSLKSALAEWGQPIYGKKDALVARIFLHITRLINATKYNHDNDIETTQWIDPNVCDLTSTTTPPLGTQEKSKMNRFSKIMYDSMLKHEYMVYQASSRSLQNRWPCPPSANDMIEAIEQAKKLHEKSFKKSRAKRKRRSQPLHPQLQPSKVPTALHRQSPSVPAAVPAPTPAVTIPAPAPAPAFVLAPALASEHTGPTPGQCEPANNPSNHNSISTQHLTRVPIAGILNLTTSRDSSDEQEHEHEHEHEQHSANPHANSMVVKVRQATTSVDNAPDQRKDRGSDSINKRNETPTENPALPSDHNISQQQQQQQQQKQQQPITTNTTEEAGENDSVYINGLVANFSPQNNSNLQANSSFTDDNESSIAVKMVTPNRSERDHDYEHDKNTAMSNASTDDCESSNEVNMADPTTNEQQQPSPQKNGNQVTNDGSEPEHIADHENRQIAIKSEPTEQLGEVDKDAENSECVKAAENANTSWENNGQPTAPMSVRSKSQVRSEVIPVETRTNSNSARDVHNNNDDNLDSDTHNCNNNMENDSNIVDCNDGERNNNTPVTDKNDIGSNQQAHLSNHGQNSAVKHTSQQSNAAHPSKERSNDVNSSKSSAAQNDADDDGNCSIANGHKTKSVTERLCATHNNATRKAVTQTRSENVDATAATEIDANANANPSALCKRSPKLAAMLRRAPTTHSKFSATTNNVRVANDHGDGTKGRSGGDRKRKKVTNGRNKYPSMSVAQKRLSAIANIERTVAAIAAEEADDSDDFDLRLFNVEAHIEEDFEEAKKRERRRVLREAGKSVEGDDEAIMDDDDDDEVEEDDEDEAAEEGDDEEEEHDNFDEHGDFGSQSRNETDNVYKDENEFDDGDDDFEVGDDDGVDGICEHSLENNTSLHHSHASKRPLGNKSLPTNSNRLRSAQVIENGIEKSISRTTGKKTDQSQKSRSRRQQSSILRALDSFSTDYASAVIECSKTLEYLSAFARLMLTLRDSSNLRKDLSIFSSKSVRSIVNGYGYVGSEEQKRWANSFRSKYYDEAYKPTENLGNLSEELFPERVPSDKLSLSKLKEMLSGVRDDFSAVFKYYTNTEVVTTQQHHYSLDKFRDVLMTIKLKRGTTTEESAQHDGANTKDITEASEQASQWEDLVDKQTGALNTRGRMILIVFSTLKYPSNDPQQYELLRSYFTKNSMGNSTASYRGDVSPSPNPQTPALEHSTSTHTPHRHSIRHASRHHQTKSVTFELGERKQKQTTKKSERKTGEHSEKQKSTKHVNVRSMSVEYSTHRLKSSNQSENQHARNHDAKSTRQRNTSRSSKLENGERQQNQSSQRSSGIERSDSNLTGDGKRKRLKDEDEDQQQKKDNESQEKNCHSVSERDPRRATMDRWRNRSRFEMRKINRPIVPQKVRTPATPIALCLLDTDSSTSKEKQPPIKRLKGSNDGKGRNPLGVERNDKNNVKSRNVGTNHQQEKSQSDVESNDVNGNTIELDGCTTANGGNSDNSTKTKNSSRALPSNNSQNANVAELKSSQTLPKQSGTSQDSRAFGTQAKASSVNPLNSSHVGKAGEQSSSSATNSAKPVDDTRSKALPPNEIIDLNLTDDDSNHKAATVAQLNKVKENASKRPVQAGKRSTPSGIKLDDLIPAVAQYITQQHNGMGIGKTESTNTKKRKFSALSKEDRSTADDKSIQGKGKDSEEFQKSVERKKRRMNLLEEIKAVDEMREKATMSGNGDSRFIDSLKRHSDLLMSKYEELLAEGI